jgi:nitroreductase
MIGPIEQALAAARLAPSGDNTQPVRFEIREDCRTIRLLIDPTRDPSPMNAGQRMARLAAGASLENLIRTAERSGLTVEVGPSDGEALAVVRLGGSATEGATAEESLSSRVTNRRVYEGRPIPPDSLERLARSTPPIEGVTTHWIVGRERIGPFADLIGKADATMFGEPSMRRALLAKIRFDEPAGSAVEEGLSVSSLEIGLADRLALRTIGWMPDRLLKLGGVGGVFGKKARQLVRSASGLCLVVAPGGSEATDVLAGRALQRAWLALAAEGLATQPMMSLLVLENVADRGNRGLIDALGHDKLAGLRDRFRALAPEIAGRRPAWLLRFGQAPSPTARTGRLPLEAVILKPKS